MSNVQINDSQVQNLFDALDEKNRSTILFKALKKGAEKLKADTQTQLKTRLGSGASSTGRLGKPMTEGVEVTTDKAYNEVTVHIMGDYRLKWFEKGTKIRKTKGHKITGYDRRYRIRAGKGGNRGQITALNFFNAARQGNIDDTVISAIDELMPKL